MASSVDSYRSGAASPEPSRPRPFPGGAPVGSAGAALPERAATRGAGARIYLAALVVTWLAVAGTAAYAGLDYYLLPLHDRPYDALHDAYRSSGRVGHGLGIAGSLMMTVGVASYSLRKRAGWLARLGKLRYWLQFHIFLCTLGPFLVTLHTSFRIGGLVSIAFWSMAVVVASGIFGRYVYARIPKTLGGQFVTRKAVEQRQAALLSALRQEASLTAPELETLLQLAAPRGPAGFLDALRLAVRYDLTRRRVQREVEHRLAAMPLPDGSRRRLAALLGEHRQAVHQMALMQAFQKLFGYWHVLHLPLAIVMFLIMAVHIVVAALFGYGWIY